MLRIHFKNPSGASDRQTSRRFAGLLPRSDKIAALCLLICLAAQATPVEPQHPVYAFLRTMTIKGHLTYSGLATLPLSQKQIQDLLTQVSGKREALKPAERRRLDLFEQEFFQEKQTFPSKLYFSNGDQELTGILKFRGGLTRQDSIPGQDLRADGTFSAEVQGRILPGLTFVSEATVGQEIANTPRFAEHYNPGYGLSYNTPNKGKSGDTLFHGAVYDAFRTIFSWETPSFILEAGRDWNQWGPGVKQHPTLSANGYTWVQDNPNIDFPYDTLYVSRDRAYRRGYRVPGESSPMTQARFKIHMGRFTYTKFVGEIVGLTLDSSGFITGHRLETVLGSFVLGVHELVVQNRDRIEWTYALPLVPLFLAEHQLGDLDNVAFGFDVQYFWKRWARIYMELMLDDLLSPTDFFRDYWGNKYAFTLGTEIPLPMPDANLTLEYARTEPWLFGHRKTNNQLQHYGSLTGSALPPNAHMFNAEWTQHFRWPLSITTGYQLWQHQHWDRGSSVFDVFDPTTDDEGKNFLGEDPETRHKPYLELAYTPNRFLSLRFFGSYEHVFNWESEPGDDFDFVHAGGRITLMY